MAPFEFELANGNQVRIMFGGFRERVDNYEVGCAECHREYWAIMVYSNEDMLSGRMVAQHDFRAGHDFEPDAIVSIWAWLERLVVSRQHIEYDWLDEFAADFAQVLRDCSEAADNAVSHYALLPELTDPEAFDKVDDSIYNDQNEPDATKDSSYGHTITSTRSYNH